MGGENKVQCSNCGFLAVKKKGVVELPLYPASLVIRQRAAHFIGGGNGWEPEPYCFRGSHRIDDQFVELCGQEPSGANFLLVIRDDRVCPDYIRWMASKTPQEHEAMYERIEMAKIASAAKARDRLWSAGQAVVIALLVAILTILIEPWKERAKQGVQSPQTQQADK